VITVDCCGIGIAGRDCESILVVSTKLAVLVKNAKVTSAFSQAMESKGDEQSRLLVKMTASMAN
jgi:hypothetical protein